MLSLLAGCWAPALQLAPVAVQATEAVGVGAASVISKSSPSPDRGADQIDRQERCDALEATPPKIIELRISHRQSQPEWRELKIDDSTGEPRWTSMAAIDHTQWLPAQNLDKMNFAPPLNLSSKAIFFLACAPAEPQSGEEINQLDGFQAEFGSGAGTFRWSARIYQYAVVTKLPCFPPGSSLP